MRGQRFMLQDLAIHGLNHHFTIGRVVLVSHIGVDHGRIVRAFMVLQIHYGVEKSHTRVIWILNLKWNMTSRNWNKTYFHCQFVHSNGRRKLEMDHKRFIFHVSRKIAINNSYRNATMKFIVWTTIMIYNWRYTAIMNSCIYHIFAVKTRSTAYFAMKTYS